MLSVCVGVVRSRAVGLLVESLRRQTCSDWELVLVAQGLCAGDDAYLGRLRSLDPRIRVLRQDSAGKSRALNLAVSRAHGELLAFTDDDCEAEPNWVLTIVDCFEKDRSIGLVAGDTRPGPAVACPIRACPAIDALEHIHRPGEPGHRAFLGFYCLGGNFAVRRSVFDHVGPFDPFLGPGAMFGAGTDVDYALRCEDAHVAMCKTPRSVVYHTSARVCGLRDILRARRIYAMGIGAIGAKLHLWNHRLAAIWNASWGLRDALASLWLDPARALLTAYGQQARLRAYHEYLRSFDIDHRKVTVPRLGLEPALPSLLTADQGGPMAARP